MQLAILIGIIATLSCLIFNDRAYSTSSTATYVRGAIIAPMITGFISFVVSYLIIAA